MGALYTYEGGHLESSQCPIKQGRKKGGFLTHLALTHSYLRLVRGGHEPEGVGILVNNRMGEGDLLEGISGGR